MFEKVFRSLLMTISKISHLTLTLGMTPLIFVIIEAVSFRMCRVVVKFVPCLPFEVSLLHFRFTFSLPRCSTVVLVDLELPLDHSWLDDGNEAPMFSLNLGQSAHVSPEMREDLNPITLQEEDLLRRSVAISHSMKKQMYKDVISRKISHCLYPIFFSVEQIQT